MRCRYKPVRFLTDWTMEIGMSAVNSLIKGLCASWAK